MTISLITWERRRRLNVRTLQGERSMFAERMVKPVKVAKRDPVPVLDPDLWQRGPNGRLFQGRDRMLSRARALVWWPMRYVDKLSLPEIALRTMGRKSAHSSVHNGLRALARPAAAEKTKRTTKETTNAT